jgi:hypothetical protein
MANIPDAEDFTMLRRFRIHLALAASLALAGAASCTADRVSSPLPAERSSLLGLTGSSSSPLITCPAGTAQSVTSTIGPLGGTLAIGNTQVVIPADAVLTPTEFTLTVPSSKYVEIQVTAGGSEHFLFALPVTVTLDYSRCPRSNIDLKPLTVWNIDPVTKALLEPMSSVDNKLTRSVLFTTLHFSGYAVADRDGLLE